MGGDVRRQRDSGGKVVNHKRKRAKRQRAGGARHGMCKPSKVVGNSTGKGDRFGKFRASEMRQIVRKNDA